MTKKWDFHLLKFEFNDGDRVTNEQNDTFVTTSSLPESGYEEYLAQQLSSGREDFNTGMNWAITSLGVVLGLVLTSSSFPDLTSWILTLTLILICSHFATRSARSYLNILRWALILRKATQLELARLKGSSGSEINALKHDFYSALENYHITWASPIKKRELMSKIIFEFGFGYFYLIFSGLLIWIGTSVSFTNVYIYSGIVGILLVIWEWTILFRSLYLKKIVASEDAKFIAFGDQ